MGAGWKQFSHFVTLSETSEMFLIAMKLRLLMLFLEGEKQIERDLLQIVCSLVEGSLVIWVGTYQTHGGSRVRGGSFNLVCSPAHTSPLVPHPHQC